MMKKWYCSRRYQCMAAVLILICVAYYLSTMDSYVREQNLDLTRRDVIIKHIEKTLQENLKLDKGTGCNIPNLDPFAKEIMKFNTDVRKIQCIGIDWVKCYFSVCRVVPIVFAKHTDILCYYREIIHESDSSYYLISATEVVGSDEYILTKSDHASVSCSGWDPFKKQSHSWNGLVAGLRKVTPPKPPKGRENSLNVLIFGFDSTSRNGFIRNMPKSIKFMTEEMNMTILKGYNIVGDGTPAALFPILTGKTELELPDVRKTTTKKEKLDDKLFLFYRMKQLGYHTAYFEDMPWVGTFQYRFNGFKKQPADHYLRSFFIEEAKQSNLIKALTVHNNKFCVGDTPRFKLMMNVTDQFLQLPGKKFGFTFVADITHDGDLIANADEDLVKLMKKFIQDGRNNDTLFIVMGDHGPRFTQLRQTIQGKLEERLPLMSIFLPNKLLSKRPEAQRYLQENAAVLTTPHDIYATVLDALDLRNQWNQHKIEGADLKRGLTLLEPIPANRSCSEAGIEPHWCSCLTWEPVAPTDPMYTKVANALVDYINSLTEPVRLICAERKLVSIQWVNINRPIHSVLSFQGAKDPDGYVGNFKRDFTPDTVTYQIKITVSPGIGVYEASLRYITESKNFVVSTRDISRTNAYNAEPHCISDTLPYLNMYCYCKK